LERGDAKGAVDSLKTAAKMSPENKEIQQTLAEAYRNNGQPEEAEHERELSQAPQAGRTQVTFPGPHE